jgi:hypothetical protein
MKSFFDRRDFAMTRVALVAVAALYPLLSLTPPLIGWVRGEPLALIGHTTTPGPPVDEAPTPGVEARYTDEVLWTIADPTVGQRLAALLPALLVTVLLGAGCLVLWRLVTVTQRGEPFDATAVRQLRALGLLVMAYGVLHPFLPSAVTLVVFWSERTPSVAATLELFSLFPFVVGTLILVVAEVFRIGLGLREDVEGLV